MSSRRNRVLAVLCSSLFALALAIVLWRARPEAATVQLIDNRDAVSDLLTRRRLAGSPASNPTLQGELYREQMPEEDAYVLYSVLSKGGDRTVFDPQTYYWEAPNFRMPRPFAEHAKGRYVLRTNQLGLRKSVDVLESKPNLRILVSGDSHTAGIVPNREQFGNLLESRLSARAPSLVTEALNAGKGGFQFYNYVGVLEKFLPLKPDVYVLAIYGGNDFVGSLSTFRYFNRLPAHPRNNGEESERWERICRDHTALVAQDLNQVVSFAKHPNDAEIALVVARQALTTIQRICEQNGIRLTLVYIPPFRDVQRANIEDQIAAPILELGLSDEDLGVTDRLANQLLEFMDTQEIECIDMRPIFRAQERGCYWQTDLHLNTLGHGLIAGELATLLSASAARGE